MELKKGDIDAGFKEAEVVVERDYYTPTVHQGYIEPHATVVRYDDSGQSMVWCCTQGHFDVRASTARLLKMDLSKLKVIASEIGGGFGGKTKVYLEPVALILSRKAGRPVRALTYDGIGHSGLIMSFLRPLRWRATTLDDVTRFLDRF